MKTSISIIGSCVANTTFRYSASLGTCPFLLKGCTTLINPFTLGTPPVPFFEDLMEQVKPINDIHSLSCKFALEKRYEDVCRGKWLIVDLAMLDRPIYEVMDSNGEIYYLSKRPLDTNVENMDAAVKEWTKRHRFEILEIENPLFDYTKEKQTMLIEAFAKRVLSFYDSEKIILIRTKRGIDQIEWDNTVRVAFNKDQTYKENEAVTYFEDVFCEVSQCKRIIDSFDNILLNPTKELHVGPSNTHYDFIYYEYSSLALDIATDESADIQERLCPLHEKYIRKFDEYRRELFEKNCKVVGAFRGNAGYEYYWRKYMEDHRGTYLSLIRERHNMEWTPVPFSQHTNLNSYVKALCQSKGQYVVFLVARETADKYWSKWTTAKDLGLITDLSKAARKSYCAVVDLPRNYVKEAFANSDDEMTLEYKMLLDDRRTLISESLSRQITLMPEIFCVLLSSKGKNLAQSYLWGKIMINNIDYSLNKRGINFVLFSLNDLCVVDSFYVDFWLDEKLTIRRS